MLVSIHNIFRQIRQLERRRRTNRQLVGVRCSLNNQQPNINTQHSTLNTQHSTFNTQHSTFNTQHSTFDTQHSALNCRSTPKFRSFCKSVSIMNIMNIMNNMSVMNIMDRNWPLEKNNITQKEDKLNTKHSNTQCSKVNIHLPLITH